MDRRSVALAPLVLAEDSLGFFRWGRVADGVLVTNDAADWALLSEAEFADLLAGRLAEGHARFAELQDKGVLREGLDLDALSERVAQRNRHVRRGPYVHVVTLTRRSPEGASLDMTAETAERVVDLALQSMSPALTFELQGVGADPLGAFEVLRHFVEVARLRNRRTTGKTLRFRIFSNFTALTETVAEWLLTNDVHVSTRLDGPAEVHNWNRQWLGGSAHADVVRWIAYFQRRAAELGNDPARFPVDALMTTTRRTLSAGREVVDEYVTHGLRTIHLRPLDSFRVSPEAWAAAGYRADEYLDFYRQTLDYIIELNRRGTDLSERMAAIFLTKILTADDAGVVDIQSPCGDGTGQIAYDVDGCVFPCDEARVVDQAGDPIFELGRVGSLTIDDVVRHPTVRAIAAASLLDAQPMCADCWNKPFCGFSPVRNFLTQGDLLGQRPRCFECKEHMAVSRRLFELLAENDADTTRTLRGWVASRPRLGNDERASLAAP